MKKTLVAFAALAVVGAASAQSSVTLFGRIDASIGSQKTTTNGVTTSDDGILIGSGANTGSRWGLRGSEDLGGGMKANFHLEQGFNIDTGADAAAGLQFSRQAWVGLSGGFGALTIGRQYDIVDNMYGLYDAFGSSGFSPNGALAGTTGAVGDTIVRQNNSVIYSTPNMGGASVTGMWAPGENKTAATSAGKHVGLMANYGAGPLAVGAGYQSNKLTGATAATTHVTVGASYDLGAAKLYGQYDGGKNKSAAVGTAYEDKGYSLGVLIPVGPASVTVGYAAETTDNMAGVEISESKSFALAGKYDLSKRTYVYAGFRRIEFDPTGANNTVKTNKYALGVVHNF